MEKVFGQALFHQLRVDVEIIMRISRHCCRLDPVVQDLYGWLVAQASDAGDNDNWVPRFTWCCGRMDAKISDSLPNGDYRLRAGAITLHTTG
ncbi:glyoside hydrolase family 61 protein [Ophiostoma piceae UAMH 11346]|uniref:Glyoside hydrolase family 61 protein n=1 Tax=Ophiostoma piceae (strain UAMH 11346) TaxID=1262450 RepID=S3BV01_OPHP1|nr:glyoside hydrolase family 61 protein [Ophiostoma piceae UAMH 11346]